jgi:hypothetical protein
MAKEKVSSIGSPKAINSEILSSFRIEEDVTSEYLDKIIQNPKENPVMRQKALLTKQQLFGKQTTEAIVGTEEEKPKPITSLASIPNEVLSKPKQVEERQLEVKQFNNESFDAMISSLKKDIYHQKIQLLSDPNKHVDLRCMTISEYKFLTRQMAIYDQSIDTINKKSETYERDVQKRESVIIGAIDNVLQRCITNDVSVLDITHFDWVYLATILRLISKGDDTIYSVKCDKKDCNTKVKISVTKLVDDIRNNSIDFIKNPLGKIPFKDKELYIALPTRGDKLFAESEFFKDGESSLNVLNTAMYIRALVVDNIAYLLSNKQRIDFLNIVDDANTLVKLDKIINDNTLAFYKSFSTVKCPSCGKEVMITFSDFIIFFFAF